jgi:adhesin transport system membrane fusion protein
MSNSDDWGLSKRRAGGRGASRFAHILLFVIAAFVITFILWAKDAKLDEVTRGEGRVISSSQVQIVQNLEGGILARIDVKEGSIVQKGEVMLRIENVAAASRLRETRSKYLALTAAVVRLKAEATGQKRIEFPSEILTGAPDTADNERNLFNVRRTQLDEQVRILRDQVIQKRQEIIELTAKVAQNQRAFDLAQQEQDLLQPLVARGISPRLEYLRVQQKVQELETLTESVILAIPRTRSALQEAERRIIERHAAFRAEAQRELNDRQTEREGLRQTMAAETDRVTRTEVRSPIFGTVNKIYITTIGGVIQPGQTLVEIVPLEDNLLIEAKIRPSDRAQLFPGLKAVIKISAYDPTIYGGLDAVLIDISADTITDSDGESFYRIRLRTETNNLGPDRPIIPGMTATAEILTGRKTVLDYLLKPLLKARDTALRER